MDRNNARLLSLSLSFAFPLFLSSLGGRADTDLCFLFSTPRYSSVFLPRRGPFSEGFPLAATKKNLFGDRVARIRPSRCRSLRSSTKLRRQNSFQECSSPLEDFAPFVSSSVKTHQWTKRQRQPCTLRHARYAGSNDSSEPIFATRLRFHGVEGKRERGS